MSFHERLSEFLDKKKQKECFSTQKSSLEESIETINEIERKKTPAFYEEKIGSLISMEEFLRCNLSLSAYPLLTTELPCLYHREDPSLSCVKKEFQDLALLKRRIFDKALWSLYSKKKILSGKILLLSWVVPGGLGDYYAAVETAHILNKEIPCIEIHLVVIAAKNAFLSQPKDAPFLIHFVRYDDHQEEFPSLSCWSQELFDLFSSADYLLQIPLYYPPLSKLLRSLLKNACGPLVDLVRQYGFISSTWLSPPPMAKSMGLHFLEMGIFVKAVTSNATILTALMKRLKIGGQDPKRRSFFAYLITESGFEAFLHAVLTATSQDPKDIDFYLHEMSWYLLHFERIQEDLRSYGLSQVVFHTSEKTVTIPLSGKGKSLRFIHTGSLTHEEFQSLLLFCEDFVGCRGDQSFSEMISANKIYFYDGLLHAVDFLKDLVSLCRYYLPDYPSTLEYLSLFLKNMAHFWKKDSREWVEREVLDYPNDLTPQQVGKKMGSLLQNSQMKEGMFKLNFLLKQKHDVAPHLTAMVKRGLIHKQFPSIAQKEEGLLQHLIDEKKSFSSTIQTLQKSLLHLKES